MNTILRGNLWFRSWEAAASTEKDTLAEEEEDTPAQGTLAEGTHPLGTLQLDILLQHQN